MKQNEKRVADECEIIESQQRVISDLQKYAPSKIGAFKAAFTGKSLRSAINAKCLDCVGFTSGEVRECKAWGCPLWLVRPYQEKRKD